MFNVRVYGILINDQHQILLSDEYIHGKYYTKFPGGGLEFGEGTKDCLKREFLEEMNLKVDITHHIYTTDFFVQSVFNPADQIISIYYAVKPIEPIQFKLTHKKFDFTPEQLIKYEERSAKIETFRFSELKNFPIDDLNFPIDKVVMQILLNNTL